MQNNKNEIIKYAHLLSKNGFVSATDGNISVKVSSDHLICTPSGIRKSELTQDDLVTLNMKGDLIHGKFAPSSEIKMHLKVYNMRSDIKAVIHAHPPICTALTIAGVHLDMPILPEVVLTLGKIPTVPYATPTTDEVPKVIEGVITDYDAVLLEKHGSITICDCLESAYIKLEKIEYTAKIIMIARQMGNVRILSDEDIAKLNGIRDKHLSNLKNRSSSY